MKLDIFVRTQRSDLDTTSGLTCEAHEIQQNVLRFEEKGCYEVISALVRGYVKIFVTRDRLTPCP